MVSYAAMSNYANNITDGMSYRKANADGTCLTVGFKMKDTIEVKTIGPKREGKSYKAAPVANKSSGLFTIKMYFLVFVNGMHGPMIYIIEDKNMPKNIIGYNHKVPGLGLGTTPDTDFGYILFVQDRRRKIEPRRRFRIKL